MAVDSYNKHIYNAIYPIYSSDVSLEIAPFTSSDQKTVA